MRNRHRIEAIEREINKQNKKDISIIRILPDGTHQFDGKNYSSMDEVPEPPKDAMRLVIKRVIIDDQCPLDQNL